MVIKFDYAGLVAELERLPVPLRVAFAAASAVRQMPAYRRFHEQTGEGDPAVLERALEDVWMDAMGAKKEFAFEGHLGEVMALIPQEDEISGQWTEEATYAQDAGMSVAYALRTRTTGAAQEAAWAASVAYEALDHFVINREGIDTNKPGAEERVLSDPIVQAELARQRRDLDELCAATPTDVRDVVARVRDRAKAEAEIFFGRVS